MPPTVTTFGKGETIFREGSSGQYAYIVKTGQVEISILRDGQKVVLTKVGPNRCFGEMGVILGEPRSATATAYEYTEAYLVNRTVLEQLMQQANPLLRTIIVALIERVKVLTETAVPHAAASNALISFATILELLARSVGSSGRGRGEAMASLPYRQCLETLKAAAATLPPFRIKEILRHMADLNLVKIDGGGDHAVVRFEPARIVADARNLTTKMGDLVADKLHTDVEFIELHELARLVEVEEPLLVRKIAQGELPSDLFLFRRTEVLKLLQDKGSQFFKKRTFKKIEDLEEFCDIEFVDQETMALAFGEVEPYDLALLLKKQDPPVCERALSALSGRMRGIITQTMGSINQVDEMRVAQLEQRIIERIKQIALGI
ncbi:putative Cyclic nucleotide-binding domain-containing protein [Gammaproteobacteria bacterium]